VASELYSSISAASSRCRAPDRCADARSEAEGFVGSPLQEEPPLVTVEPAKALYEARCHRSTPSAGAVMTRPS
jgi:hypothetical protein